MVYDIVCTRTLAAVLVLCRAETPRLNRMDASVHLRYFPQDTTEDMGPTGLLPRSQYFTRNHEGALQGEDQLDIRVSDGRMSSDELSQRDECLREAVASLEPHQPFQEMKAVVPAGTCILMHYDIFHRATRRIPDDANVPWRAMLKFQYVRTTEPMEPSWDSTAGAEANPFAFTNVRRKLLLWSLLLLCFSLGLG